MSLLSSMFTHTFQEQCIIHPNTCVCFYICQSINPLELSSTEFQDNTNVSCTAKQPLLGNIIAGEGLQKVDSFSKWMSKELAGVDLDLKPSSEFSWIVSTASVDDPSEPGEDYSMSPSIGQDQLFDIQDFSPSCSSTDTETKVILYFYFTPKT